MKPSDIRAGEKAGEKAGPSTEIPDLAVDKLTVAGGVSRRPLASARILVVGANYSPEPAGIGPRTASMARHLAQVAGHVTVFTGVPHHPTGFLSTAYRQRRRHQTLDGLVRVVRHRHPTPESDGAIATALYEGVFFRGVMQTPLIDPPHVVIGVTPSVGGALAAARLARRHRARLLIVVQDLVPERSRRSVTARWALRRAERMALLEADEVTVVHESLRHRVVALGVDEDRVQVIPNPDHGSAATLDPATARKKLGWPREAVIVVRTGNVDSAQESALLLRTARLLEHTVSGTAKVRLLVVGEGSRLAELRAAAAGLRSIGFVDPSGAAQYPRVLAAADILLLTERSERPDPSVLGRFSAYVAAGRPIVAALHLKSPAAADAARVAAAGAVRLVAADDPGGLAAAITLIAGDAHRRRLMTEAVEAEAAKRLTSTTAGERIERLVESLLWSTSVVPLPRRGAAARADQDT